MASDRGIRQPDPARHLLLLFHGMGPSGATVHRWPLDLDRLSAAWADTLLPSPLQIEAAIEAVEQQVMQRPAAPGDARRLIAIGGSAGAWSSVAGPQVSLDTVEGWFDALVLAPGGRPSVLDGLSHSRHDLAALVVLREVMHHLGHATVDLRRSAI